MKQIVRISMILLSFFCCAVLSLPAQVIIPINPDFNNGGALGAVTGSSSLKRFDWAPARNAREGRAIWTNGEKWKFLNTASIMGTTNTGSAFVDIVSDFLGPVRFALATVVSATKDNVTQEENIEKFLSGGGTAVITTNFIGPTFRFGETGYMTILINPKVGFDFPALGSSTDDSNANFDLGGELRIYVPFSENKIGLLSQVRTAGVFGGDKFYESLEFPVEDRKAFNYSQFSIGLTFPNLNMALLWNKTISGPSNIIGLHESGRISLVVSPE